MKTWCKILDMNRNKLLDIGKKNKVLYFMTPVN